MRAIPAASEQSVGPPRKGCRYLVKEFGMSHSLKATRLHDSR
ncbi:MAG: hypothetical protein AB2807_07070 [Candidatus Sedimenticola endophacoides]